MSTGTRTLGAALLALAGVGMVLYAGVFIVRNVTGLIELGIPISQVGMTSEQIQAVSPGVYNYISHVQGALGGFLAATGLALAFLGWYGVRRGEAWAWWSSALTTALWAAILLPFHYVYGFGNLIHLAPTYMVIAVVAAGLYLARPEHQD